MIPPVQPAPVLGYLRAALGPGADGPPDGDLLARFIADRDQAAFELLVWRHAGTVHRVCRGVLRDHHAAEDVTQTAFLTLARKAESIGRRGAVGAWLHKVAYRIAVRAAARRASRAMPADGLDQIAAADDTGLDRDAVRLLHATLAKMPDKYRAPILLCYFDGLSHADAARRLGWPVGTVAARIARAKTYLERRLAGRVVVPAAGLAALCAADTAPALAPNFVTSTAQAAVAFSSGTILPAVSPTVAQLAHEAIRTMAISKIQMTAGVIFACGALTVGGFYAAAQVPGSPGGRGPVGPAGVTPVVEVTSPSKTDRLADFTQRQRSQKNLRTILLAIHNYHDAHGTFPSDVVDKNGKAILSWRVVILPYMEQDSLAKQIRMSEAWDSEDNLKLLAQMPEVYRVGFEPKGATHTHYQRFSFIGNAAAGGGGGPPGGMAPGIGGPLGPGTGDTGGQAGGSGGFGTPGIGPMGVVPTGPRFPSRITDITDGSSNTLAVIESGPPVPWTKPADIVIDANQPLPKISHPFANVIHAAAYDGSTYPFRTKLDEATLSSIIFPSDGRVNPELKSLKASFAAESEEEKKALAALVKENEALIADYMKLLDEHSALLTLTNKLSTDFEKAEAIEAAIKKIATELKTRNRQLRDEIGLREGRPVPKSIEKNGK